MGRAVESPSVDMFPTSCALLVGHGQCQMATDVLDHQFTDGLVDLGCVCNPHLVGSIVELEVPSVE
jgi:hypothetical protein